MVGSARASAVVGLAALAMAITGMQALVPSSAAAKILLFEDVTNTSGIDLQGVTHSVVWGDYNNDGCPDLWISKHSGDDGQAANLYRNLCNGHFVDVTKATVGDLRGNLDFHGAAWADFDNDGDVDLMQLRGGGEGVGVGPNLRARLFVNSGGKLVDRAAEFGVDYHLARGRMPLWLDYDNDEKLDLFFGADHRPDGKRPDLYITRQPQTRPDQLFINTGARFVDRSRAAGISRLQIAGNAVVTADFDNDGDRDLYIDQADQANRPNILLENRGDGTFVAISDTGGPTDTTLGRGGSMAVADYDNDGFLDIALTNGEHQTGSKARVQLLHNRGNSNHWLKVKLVGNSSNRDAIGAIVVIATNGIRQLREANGGSIDLPRTIRRFISVSPALRRSIELASDGHQERIPF